MSTISLDQLQGRLPELDQSKQYILVKQMHIKSGNPPCCQGWIPFFVSATYSA